MQTSETSPNTGSNSSIALLHVIPWFYPATAFGGPIFSTKAITDGVSSDQAFELDVYTSDRADPHSSATLNEADKTLMDGAPYKVHYHNAGSVEGVSLDLLSRLPKAIKNADIVHLTGPYNVLVLPTLFFCRLYNTPLVWSPRGGFQATGEWEGVPRRRAKLMFEKLCSWLMPKQTTIHVTADIERHHSETNFSRADIVKIPNAVTLPETLSPRIWRKDGQFRMAFLSRVHPKKGIELLIEAMSKLPEYFVLDVYGDGSEEYLAQLGRLVEKLKLQERVTFKGHVNGEDKTKAFVDCDLFVLPTYSENFGIVVAEALAHGTPVLTTVNTPWGELESKGCGRSVEADVDALAGALLDLEQEDLEGMGKRGREWAAEDYSAEGMSEKFVQLYKRIVA